MDQRDMRHHRHLPSEGLVDLRLPRRIVEVVVTANDMGDTHIMIIDHDREHVGRGAVRAQQDKVIEICVLPDHAALDLVFDHRLSRQRRFDADHRVDTRWRGFGVAIAATSIIETCAAFGPGLLAHRGKFILAAITAIAVARGQQLLGHLAMARGARKLEDNLSVPGNAEPGQSIDNGVYRRRCRPFPVGILDPQEHLAAMPSGVQPVEQGRAAATDMEKSSGRGRKTGNDGLGHREPSTTVSRMNVSAIDIEASSTSYGPRDTAQVMSEEAWQPMQRQEAMRARSKRSAISSATSSGVISTLAASSRSSPAFRRNQMGISTSGMPSRFA